MTKPSPHYYPFGSLILNRSWSDASRVYRYGFNGKEKDFETSSDNYDFGARIYDGRLGRWLSLDWAAHIYPYQSAYCGHGDNPILFLDIDGNVIIIGTTVLSADIDREASCLGDVIYTNVQFNFTYNSITNEVDILFIPTIHFNVRYNAILNYNGEVVDGTLDRYNRKHEEEHVRRYIASANLQINYSYNGGIITGNLSVVLTSIRRQLFDPINEKYRIDKESIHKTYESRINEALNKGDMAEYERLKNERDEKLRTLSADHQSKLNQANDMFNIELRKVTSAWEVEANRNQNHTGDNNVIDAALENMTEDERAWNRREVYNENGEVLGNCDDED